MSKETKLTNDEIIKALECCAIGRCCSKCPYIIKKIDCVLGQRVENDLLDFIHRFQAKNEEQYKRIMELEQDLVHADEKVFYRECDVALNEKKIANKALNEFAEKIIDESFVVFMGDPIIRASKVRELLKEFTNEN